MSQSSQARSTETTLLATPSGRYLDTLMAWFNHPATEIRVICPYSEFFLPEVLVAPDYPGASKQFLERCDAVILTFGYMNDLFDDLQLAARAVKILFYHGVTPVDCVPRTQAKEIVASFRQLDRLGPFDGVVVNSNYLFSQLSGIRSIKSWTRRERIGLPLRNEFFSDVPASLQKEQSSFLARRRRFSHCGRIVEPKGVDKLLRAFSRSQALARGWKLVIAGAKVHSNSEYIDKLNISAQTFGCAKQVAFSFDLPTESLVRLFDASGLYASASTHEGFGYPIAEHSRGAFLSLVAQGARCPKQLAAWLCTSPHLYCRPAIWSDFGRGFD